jgi:hypothetical protein
VFTPRFIPLVARLGVLRPRPVHDWTSHSADSFRMAAIAADFVGAAARIAGFNRRIEMPHMSVA